MATIDDVAQRAGVSKSSVSRVLNGNFEYMSEEMKNKILAAIAEMNYSPNSLAQSLKKKKTKVIGIILSDISNPFWAEILKGAQEEANRCGYGIMVSSSNEDPELERDNILMLKSRQVDGVIVNTIGNTNELFEEFIAKKYPFVLLDRLAGDMKADTVVVNNVNGAKQAIQYLIDQGHRRIGILLYPTNNKSPRIERLEGYKQALSINGLPIDESLIKICDQNNGSGIQATQELLSMPDRPTAIFTTNARLNLEVLSGAKKAGLRVPTDVSIFGYDDFPWIPLLDPPLSTVAQPAYEMGVKAVALLIHRLESKKKMKPQIIQLEPKIIIRASCSSPVKIE
ncbi:LacI family transcriptional regulator [Paenibacillus sp. JMULE4]|uniref:LacI family DNA-binding transcriptional regulator n=1 Tax=Paenibacillus TaxID=44249 RepID=UPI0015753094|nr:LacI family DNA-binding transcriptional regulator [Paenibacillus sp. JMULE4]NTZ17819.1 LacI family transcriptional regulator [Paenibacillus sp. JMULE4]